MKYRTLWLTAGLLLLLSLLAYLARRRVQDVGSFAPPLTSSGQGGASEPKGPGSSDLVGTSPVSPTKGAPAITAGTFSSARSRSAFAQTYLDIKADVLGAVERALRSGKGPLALRLIRTQVFLATMTDEERIRSACHARLIAYVAQRDPAVLDDALALSRQILSTPSVDPLIRLQAIAGLAGLPSMEFGFSILPGSDLNFRFQVKAAPANEFVGRYESSLAEAARLDPASANLLLQSLSHDPDFHVRAASAMAIPRLGSAEAGAALAAAMNADQVPAVRTACLNALGDLNHPDAPALARTVILQDPSDEDTEAALQVLCRTAPKDPETGRFLTQCLVSGKLDESPEALVRSAFQILSLAPSDPLQQGLSSLLVRCATTLPDLVDVFVEQTVSLGMTQFKPLFASLLASFPDDSAAHDNLARGLKQLDNAPHYVQLAAQIREKEAQVRGLWVEHNRPGTSPARANTLWNQISAEARQLEELRGKLRE